MLSRIIGPFQVKEYFHWMARAKNLGEDLQEDLSFLHTLRRSFLPIPLLEPEPTFDTDLFPSFRRQPVPALAGKKIGIVATGGSGAMACVIGVVRACEEAGLDVAAISSCSGSALFLAPVAAGLSAQETLDFILSWHLSDYLDPDWTALLRIPATLAQGFSGLIKAEAIERLYHERLGGVLVGDLPIPFYGNLWDLDHNRHLYMGTRVTPGMRLARLVRASVSLPIYVQPLEIDGIFYGDGGVINIFPVDPLLEQHPEIDFFLGINAFYPRDFAGEDVSGWQERRLSPLQVSPQALYAQHLEIARLQLRQIEDRCLMVHPLPYRTVRGVKFYEQFLDRRRWPEFVLRGYYHARRAFQTLEHVTDE